MKKNLLTLALLAMTITGASTTVQAQTQPLPTGVEDIWGCMLLPDEDALPQPLSGSLYLYPLSLYLYPLCPPRDLRIG